MTDQDLSRTIMYPLSQPSPRVFSLPSELVEETLVIAAAQNFPAAIAAFGRSCRRFHRLVYRSNDQHLWREIFLTTFDDPRLVLRRLGGMTTVGPGDKDIDVIFDWAGEFKRRMEAAKVFRTLNASIPKVFDLFSDTSGQEDTSLTLVAALETLISVLETAMPFPSHRVETTIPSPSFPPLVTLRTLPSFPDEFTSRSSAWVEEIFKYGYPPSLIKKYLLAGRQPSKPVKATEDNLFMYAEECQLFHKLVFRKGFSPLPAHSRAPWTLVQSSEDQVVAAREVARSRVYNLRYLRPERCWGPFLPATGFMGGPDAKHKSPPAFPDFEQELSRYMLSNFIVDDGSDSDDENFVPEDETEDESEDVVQHILPFGRRRFDPKFEMPQPHEVVPDYIYLSSARLLVEMNLRNLMMTDKFEVGEGTRSLYRVVDALASLDFGRMGGAPAFWESSWVKQQNGSEEEHKIPAAIPASRKGKGKATEVEWIEGWDWAGVTGHWMRVVCWLDYRDLLLHNLHGYNGDDMGETIHLFPMDLRISGYSQPPKPHPYEVESTEDLVWKLPVIHVEGEARGSDTDFGSHLVRKVTGTVRMLKDGVVRWSLTSSYPNEDAPEWVNESIQIGSIGSVVGILGMWTGAEHASTDPLGPSWAWRVA